MSINQTQNASKEQFTKATPQQITKQFVFEEIKQDILNSIPIEIKKAHPNFEQEAIEAFHAIQNKLIDEKPQQGTGVKPFLEFCKNPQNVANLIMQCYKDKIILSTQGYAYITTNNSKHFTAQHSPLGKKLYLTRHLGYSEIKDDVVFRGEHFDCVTGVHSGITSETRSTMNEDDIIGAYFTAVKDGKTFVEYKSKLEIISSRKKGANGGSVWTDNPVQMMKKTALNSFVRKYIPELADKYQAISNENESEVISISLEKEDKSTQKQPAFLEKEIVANIVANKPETETSKNTLV